jgi:hypothetical protein
MNFKTIGFNVAIAAMTVVGAAMASAPAQAYDIYSRTLSFGGDAKLVDNAGPVDQLNFLNGSIGGYTSTEFGAFGKKLTLTNLNLLQTSSTTWELASTATNFITGLDNDITVTLEKFSLSKVGTTYGATLGGFFSSPKFPKVAINEDPEVSGFGSTLLLKSGTTYAANIKAVPTPALLPGLASLALGVLRKRKNEDGEEAGVEVGVEA